MSETALVNVCLKWLRIYVTKFCWRVNTGGAYYGKPGQRRQFVRFGVVGQSDLTGVLPGGRALFVECKVGINKPTWAQQQFLDQAKAHGAFAVCVWSLDGLILAWEKRDANGS